MRAVVWKRQVVLTVERGVVRLVSIPDTRNGGSDEACWVNRTDLARTQRRVRTHLTIGIAEVTKRVGSILRTWCHTPHATRHTPAKFSVLVRKREGAGANLVGEFVVELDAFRRLAHRDLVAYPPTIHQ